MTTTPTLWGNEATFSSFFTDFGPKVVGLDDGTFAIVWERDGGDLVGRHFDELGGFTGGDFMAPLSGAQVGPLSAPQVLEQTDGQLVVAYTRAFGPDDLDVNWHNAVKNNPHAGFKPLESTGLNEFLLDAAARSVGGSAYLFGFEDRTGATSFVLRFADASGNAFGLPITVGPKAGEAQQNHAIASLHTGFVAVASENVNQTTFEREVRFHIYAPGGGNITGDVPASLPGANAGFPEIVELQNNTFVVAWQQGEGIAFRQYVGNGTALDPTPVVVPNSAGGLLPKITALNDGGFVVGWVARDGVESDGSAELDVFLQRFDGLGNAVGEQVHIDKPGDQGLFSMDLATLDDGRVIVTYGSETGDATNVNTLNYQIFDPREALLIGDDGNDNIVGREDGSQLIGRGGEDKLTGRNAADFLEGDGGNDTLFGFGGNDRLTGGAGNDALDGGGGRGDTAIYVTETQGLTVSLAAGRAGVTGQAPSDTLVRIENVEGGQGGDVLIGDGGANTLEGRGGADRVNGNGGGDTLVGGGDRDTLQGGAGADRFTYLNLEDSLRGAGRDVILDFSRAEGDRIDLRTVDAIADVHDSAFAFIGAAAFGGEAGELRFARIAGGLLVSGDVDGDRIADLQVELTTGLTSLNAGDFFL